MCSENAAWHYLLTCSSLAFSKVGPTALLLYCAPWLREKGGMLMEVMGQLSLVLQGRAVVTVELQNCGQT
jgi:hypothetical protein